MSACDNACIRSISRRASRPTGRGRRAMRAGLCGTSMAFSYLDCIRRIARGAESEDGRPTGSWWVEQRMQRALAIAAGTPGSRQPPWCHGRSIEALVREGASSCPRSIWAMRQKSASDRRTHRTFPSSDHSTGRPWCRERAATESAQQATLFNRQFVAHQWP
jgi:hypothetical protein